MHGHIILYWRPKVGEELGHGDQWGEKGTSIISSAIKIF